MSNSNQKVDRVIEAMRRANLNPKLTRFGVRGIEKEVRLVIAKIFTGEVSPKDMQKVMQALRDNGFNDQLNPDDQNGLLGREETIAIGRFLCQLYE